MNLDRKEFKLANGKTVAYVSCDLLAYSDYGGGSVCAANIRWLEETWGAEHNAFPPDYADDQTVHPTRVVNIESGSWGTRRAWVLEKIWDQEGYNAELSGYPVFDDQTLSLLEQEWVEVVWNDYVKKDVLELVVKKLEHEHKYDDEDDEDWEFDIDVVFGEERVERVMESIGHGYIPDGEYVEWINENASMVLPDREMEKLVDYVVETLEYELEHEAFDAQLETQSLLIGGAT